LQPELSGRKGMVLGSKFKAPFQRSVRVISISIEFDGIPVFSSTASFNFLW